MTKSTITREQAQKIIVAADEVITALAGTNEDVHPDDSKKMCELWDDLNDRHAPPVVVRELARMALAAMDGEPVAEVVSIYGDPEAFGEREIRSLVGIQQMPYGTKLYRHAQPAPVVLDAIDTNLIEALRLVQCMLDDYRERNYGDAQGWIRHINTHMSDYTEAHGDDAYSVLHNLITAAPQEDKP